MDYTNLLPQKVMYWPAGSNTMFGELDFQNVQPREIAARVQPNSDMVRQADGREIQASSVVYTGEALEVGGFVLVPPYELTEETARGMLRPPEAAAVEVRKVGASPSLDASNTLHKAWVG